MPLPPAHALSVLFLFLKNQRFFDPLALLMSATAVDLEPLYYIVVGNALEHQIWHGYFLLLTVYPLLILLAVYAIENFLPNQLWSTYNVLRWKPVQVKYSLFSIYVCCLIGAFSHVFFDMFTHESLPFVIYPFFVGNNPFYIGNASWVVEAAVVVLALYSIYCWIKSAKSP